MARTWSSNVVKLLLSRFAMATSTQCILFWQGSVAAQSAQKQATHSDGLAKSRDCIGAHWACIVCAAHLHVSGRTLPGPCAALLRPNSNRQMRLLRFGCKPSSRVADCLIDAATGPFKQNWHTLPTWGGQSQQQRSDRLHD